MGAGGLEQYAEYSQLLSGCVPYNVDLVIYAILLELVSFNNWRLC
jgi:hypothetical protein